MRGNRRRWGFTLVEVMFAAVISATLMGVLYNVFHATTQQSYKVGAKYQAMQSALVASELLSREIERLVTLPVQKDAQGFVVPRYGDHGRPVRLAEDSRGVAFFVPGPRDPQAGQKAVPLSLDLVPASVPGVFALRRSLRGATGGDDPLAAPESGEAGDSEGVRVIRGVQLRSLKFRLLSPDAEMPALRSPDDNFYLEAVVVGTDQQGEEESPLSLLEPLTFPSERRYDPSVPTVEYAPEAPLAPVSVAVNPTPAEKKAAEDLTQLADDWRDGKISDEELVEKAREALDPVVGTTPTGPITALRPEVAPIPPDAVVLTPPESGVPVIGPPKGGTGPTTILPPPPGGPPPAPPGPGGGDDTSGEYTFWGRAKVFDANGNEIWAAGFEGGGETSGATDSDQFQQDFRGQMDGLENNMNAVARSTMGQSSQAPAP